ncbi:hypothetical protein AS593_08725 [Caulobacter vibrioides]|nr:hypothetical protein AS593_08725 [Caulobacter vibrioides]
MLLVIGGIAAATLCFLALAAWKARKADEQLNLVLMMAHAEAKGKLSSESLAKLHAHLEELAATTHLAHSRGMSAREASRMGKHAAIESIAKFIQIEDMFPDVRASRAENFG